MLLKLGKRDENDIQGVEREESIYRFSRWSNLILQIGFGSDPFIFHQWKLQFGKSLFQHNIQFMDFRGHSLVASRYKNQIQRSWKPRNWISPRNNEHFWFSGSTRSWIWEKFLKSNWATLKTYELTSVSNFISVSLPQFGATLWGFRKSGKCSLCGVDNCWPLEQYANKN